MVSSASSAVPSPVPTYLTDEQVRALLQQAQPDKNMSDLLTLALHTGMRKSEIMRLRWDDVYFEQSMIFVPEKDRSAKRFLPMSESVKEVLESRIGGQHQSEFVFGAQAAG